MISKIRIKNFRQIKDQTIEFQQAVVVIGPNNGGKVPYYKQFHFCNCYTCLGYWKNK
ncbi:MAG: AAA family ATPase [Saprospiraceae bacterium]|nr:AAA family ATPase [Saprospiraceae bacterium]